MYLPILYWHFYSLASGNLDGIFPPSAQSDNAPSKRQQSPQNHNKPHHSASSTIQNNYNYNVVEVLEELSLIDDLASSDEESNNTQENAASVTPRSSAENDSIPPYVDTLNKRQKEHRSQQKKSQKLSQIIFGGLSQPVRALSSHPYITCDLVSNGQRLCPPQQTQYKQMSKRYEYEHLLL